MCEGNISSSSEKHKASRFSVLPVIMAVLFLAALCWFGKKQEYSETERRELAKFPEFSKESILSGVFMEEFETYVQDHFPFREKFRSANAVLNRKIYGKTEDNGLYIKDGNAAAQQLILNLKMLDHASESFLNIYKMYLEQSDTNVYFSVIPDKYYYLSKENHCPSMDYEKLISYMCGKNSQMEYIGITDLLSSENYYKTDTHWRQETIGAVAERLLEAMGTENASGTEAEKYSQKILERPFYGVYCGQSALPLKPDTIVYVTNPVLEECIVTSYDTGMPEEASLYNMEKAEGKDTYEMFLGGSDALLTVENPKAATDRELVIFRDSFSSSLAPLLIKNYRKITLVDIRYIQKEMLGYFIEFDHQDVLFLYSAMLLNDSLALK